MSRHARARHAVPGPCPPAARPGGASIAVLGTSVLLAAAGCSLVGAGAGGTGDANAQGDTRGAPAAVSTRDTAPEPAAADSGVSLRDSVLAVLDSARAPADTSGGTADEDDPPRREPRDVAEPGPSGPVLVTDVDSLKALGPVYTPYDVGPVLRKGDVEGLLRATILPVVRKHDLAPDEWARFWVLVDRQGRVVDAVDHLVSGHGAFDDAARVAARQLRFRPAVRDEEFVPVWILVRISLLMA